MSVLVVLFWFLYFLNRREKHLIYVALSTTSLFGLLLFNVLYVMEFSTYNHTQLWVFLVSLCAAGLFAFMPLLVAKVFKKYIPFPLKVYAIASTLLVVICFFAEWDKIALADELFSLLLCIYYVIVSRKTLKGANWAIVIGLILTTLVGVSLDTINTLKIPGNHKTGNR